MNIVKYLNIFLNSIKYEYLFEISNNENQIELFQL